MDETRARQTIRQSSLQNSLSNIWRRTRRDLASRSALFYRLELSQNPSFHLHNQTLPTTDDTAPNERQQLLQRIYQYPLMFYSGMFFMFLGLVNGLLFIPSFFLFLSYGTLYPIIQLIWTLATDSAALTDSSHLLSLVLTSVYLFLITLLLLLSPAVSQFQLFRTDIVDLKEFPAVFYHPTAVVREIHRRFNAERDRRDFEDYLETRLGLDMLREVRGYVEDYHKIWK
jgi:hypothetical protein